MDPTENLPSYEGSNGIHLDHLVTGNLPNVGVRNSKIQVCSDKSLLNVTVGGEFSITLAIVPPWDEQYYTMPDTVLEGWLYQATYPPRT
jgi:hypothetical protein